MVAGGLLRSQEGQDEQDVLFRALRSVGGRAWGRVGGAAYFLHALLTLSSHATGLPLLAPRRDFNLPKILSQDLPVFNGLLSDIFPSVDPPRQRDPNFEEVIRTSAIELGLEPDEDFVRQVVSLRWVRPAAWGSKCAGSC